MQKYVAALTAAFLVVACGGDSTTPKQATVSSVTMSQQTATMDVGASLTLTATPKDGSGNTMAGRATTWTSSNSNVATVSNGAVVAVAPGTATITATIDGKTATTVITVQLAPVATVTISPPAATVLVGGQATLTAVLKDANGLTLTGRTVTWSTSDPAKVTVVSSGAITAVVSGVALGSATITATSEGKSGTATVTVSDGTAPIVTSVAPDTLTPGITATITGSGFGPNPGDNAVSVGGVTVLVTAASATELTIVLPATFPCQATQNVPVIVVTSNGPGSTLKPLKVAVQRSLTVGQALLILDYATLTCNELSQTGGRYVLSVYSTATAASATSQFELKGASVPTGSPAIAAGGTPPSLRTTVATRPALGSVLGSAERAQFDRDAEAMKQHGKLLESDRAFLRSHARSFRRTRRGVSSLSASVAAGTGTSASSAAPVPLTVGAMTTLRVRKLENCTQFDSVRARVVYVGSKNVVLEDSVGALARTMDADLTSIGQDFDNVMYPILTANFGDPLKVDQFTDNNGRILMLFTPQVNARGSGLQGFVSVCDFFDPDDPNDPTPASNLAEIFYARVPTTTTGSFLNPNSLPGWRANMRGTIIHESKHITAYAEKLSDPTVQVLEESWLEEGTAQVASELYSRTKYTNASWKSNAPYETTVYCDFHPTAGGVCNHGQFIMGDHFLEVYRYYQEHETKSYLSSASSDITIYGSAWMFARWITDQYATTEGAFLKSIVHETHLTGVENVVNKTGRSYPELNGYFTLSFLADDYPGFSPPNGAKYTFPSWNTPDILAGIAGEGLSLGGVALNDPTPLLVHAVSFGAFDVTVAELAGGSGSTFELSGTQSGRQLIELRAGAAALPPQTPLRLAILRVQ